MQGSVLGPLLFLVYIEKTHCDGNVINLFADDVLLFRIITDAHDLKLIQQRIDSVGDWVEDNNLCLNSNKCKCMTVSRVRSRGVQRFRLMFYNNLLEQVAEYKYKYLGVTITSNLSWSAHISSISSKAHKLVGMLYHHFYPWSSSETLHELYIAMIVRT